MKRQDLHGWVERARAELGEGPEERRVEALNREILDAAFGPARRPVMAHWSWAAGGALVAGVVVALAGWWMWSRQPPGPARPQDGSTYVARETPLRLELEGGNTVRFSPDSEGRLVASTRQEVRLLLVRGELTSAVRTPVRWTVQAGPYLIQAAGTEYVVGWAAGRLDVTVRSGRVIVTGGDAPAEGWTVVAGEHLSLERGRLLHKGPSLVAGPVSSTDDPERPSAPLAGPPVPGESPVPSESPVPGESPVPPGPAGDPDAPVARGPEPGPPASAPEQPGPADPRVAPPGHAPGQMTPPPSPGDVPRSSTPGPGLVALPEAPAGMPAWKALLLKEEYAKAVAELERSGLADFADTAGLADLQAAANAARYAGRGRTAITLLTTLRQRFPGTTASQMAAFLIGRVHSEQLGDHRAAVGWFSTYLAESPSGELVEQALGRKMDAAHRAGQREAARATAAELLRRYPASPFVSQANRILTEAK